MKRTAIAIFTVLSIALPAAAANLAIPRDAEALVAKLVKAVVADSAVTYREVTAKDPKWVRGDLYPVVLDAQGIMLAHGANEKMVGKAVLDLEDADGKQFGRALNRNTLANGKAWTDYKYKDPFTKKISPKSMYCEKVRLKSGDVLACAGIYKL